MMMMMSVMTIVAGSVGVVYLCPGPDSDDVDDDVGDDDGG